MLHLLCQAILSKGQPMLS